MNAETNRSLPSLLHPAIQNATRALSLVAIVGLALCSGWAARGRHHDESPISLHPFQVDLNHAAVHELMLLPGVGPRTAQRILEDRKTNGPFLSLDDLQRVPGIGPKTIQEIAPHCMPIVETISPHRETLFAER